MNNLFFSLNYTLLVFPNIYLIHLNFGKLFSAKLIIKLKITLKTLYNYKIFKGQLIRN